MVRHQPPASRWGGNLIRKSGQEEGRQTTEALGMETGRCQSTAVPHKGRLGSRGRRSGNKSSQASRTGPIRSRAFETCGKGSISSLGTRDNSTQARGPKAGLQWKGNKILPVPSASEEPGVSSVPRAPALRGTGGRRAGSRCTSESFRGPQSVPRCGFTHSGAGRGCQARNHVWCLHFSGLQGPIKQPERPQAKRL